MTAKGFRAYFHVLPTAKRKITEGFDWKVYADKPTREWLVANGNAEDAEPAFYKTKADAMMEGRDLADRHRPSELIWHRRPKPGEKPNVFPIQGRSTYGNDPNPPEGFWREGDR